LRYRLYMEMLIGEYLLWEDVRSGRAKWDLGEGEGRDEEGKRWTEGRKKKVSSRAEPVKLGFEKIGGHSLGV